MLPIFSQHSFVALSTTQIARTTDNMLRPLTDGVDDPRVFARCKVLYDVKQAIRLGLWRAVLTHHRDEVVCIAAKGAQSVGKSTHLNHLGEQKGAGS